MGRRLGREPYPFTWMDEVVEVWLNPVSAQSANLTVEETDAMINRFQREASEASVRLKQYTFFMVCTKKITAIVEHYQASLNILKSQTLRNLAAYPHLSHQAVICNFILEQLDRLSLQLVTRFEAYIPNKVSQSDKLAPEQHLLGYKIICNLSVDQLGIMLKAADDTKLIIARSLSAIFKAVVPYLSTERKHELSWDSMRSNSYHPEAVDKEAAIQALENLIRKIREY